MLRNDGRCPAAREMIVFGSAITDPEVYEKYAEPGFERVREPDSKVIAYGSIGSLFATYNTILDQALQHDDLEAVVLVHQDAELMDKDFCDKVRRELQDPDVALVGCGGAVGVRSIAWWEGQVTWANFTTQFQERGGGEIHGLSWLPDETPTYAHTGEVEAIDGFVIVMSPWAVRELRFDESLGRIHGYDLDLCMQARAAGKKVMTADFRAIHHHSIKLIGDEEGWIMAHMRVADKWEGYMHDNLGDDWKQRARRAEAEVDAIRLQVRLAEHFVNRLTAQWEALEESRSWKLTAPIRWLAYTLRRLRHPGQPPPPRADESILRSPRASVGTPTSQLE
jgi:GT2 family glycosyltransferase